MAEASTEVATNRVRGKELSVEAREAITTKWKLGEKPTQMAQEFQCSRESIYGTIRRWKKYKDFNSRPRSGRPKRLSERDSRTLIREAKKQPFLSYKNLVAEAGLVGEVEGNPALRISGRTTTPSRSTIYRNLKRRGYTKYHYGSTPDLNGESTQTNTPKRGRKGAAKKK